MEYIAPIAKIAALTVTFAALDRAITALRLQRPYYAVHVIHNLAVTALTAPDLITSVTRLPESQSLPINWEAVYLVNALHIYHSILYWRTFRFDDWLHHILMIGVALPLGCLVPAGPLMGFSLFFTTGLPGAIGYAALWAERNGWLSRLWEKRISQTVNVWVRAPGCVAQGALTLAVTLSSPLSPTYSFLWWVGLIEVALNVWNGLYFMEQVVVASTTTRIREAAPAGANNRGQADGPRPAMDHEQ
jgi:hypothetical protein